MKKYSTIILSFVLISCGVSNSIVIEDNKLYEVLLQKSDGGGNIRFFEILSEPREIKMLQNDDSIGQKFSLGDIQKSNFVILNMGEQVTAGYSIGVQSVVETDTNVIITVKENSPESGSILAQVITYPFCVVKINSKKEIIIK
jgi:hypothetical protein